MILQIKDGQGNWISIPAIKGEPGEATPEYIQMYEAVMAAKDDITEYYEATEDNDVFTLDLDGRPVRNFKMEISDTNAKTVVLDNVPEGDCEIFIRLKMSAAASVTWWNNIVWLAGEAPALSEDCTYRIAVWKEGETWQADCIGGWSDV